MVGLGFILTGESSYDERLTPNLFLITTRTVT
jgi:hypothetical protein